MHNKLSDIMNIGQTLFFFFFRDVYIYKKYSVQQTVLLCGVCIYGNEIQLYRLVCL